MFYGWKRVARRALLCILGAALAGCGGGGSSTGTPPLPQPAPKAQSSVPISITIPPPSQATSGVHRAYVSSATQSVVVSVDGGATVVAFNTTPSSPNCTTAGPFAPLVCSFNVSVYQGTHTFTITEYDQPQTGSTPPFVGNVLATGTTPAQTIGPSPTAITIVPDGVPKSLVAIASAGSAPVGTTSTHDFYMAGGFGGNESFKLTVAAQDAAGAYFIGNGAPAYTVVSSAPSVVAVTAPSVSSPNAYTITANAVGNATLTITATGNSGGSVSQQYNVVATPYNALFSGTGTNGTLAPGSASTTVYTGTPGLSSGGNGELYAENTAGALRLAADGSTTLIDTSHTQYTGTILDVTASYAGDPLMLGYDNGSPQTCYLTNQSGTHTSLANVTCATPYNNRIVASTTQPVVYYVDAGSCFVTAYDTTTAAQTGTVVVPNNGCQIAQFQPQQRPAFIPAGSFGAAHDSLAFSDPSCDVSILDLQTAQITPVAGSGTCAGAVDGTKTGATFTGMSNGSLAITFDPVSDDLFVLDGIFCYLSSSPAGCSIAVRAIDSGGNVSTIGRFSGNSMQSGYTVGQLAGSLSYPGFDLRDLVYSHVLHQILFGSSGSVYGVRL